MAFGGALGNTRALTFLALKVLRWVANWGRTAVVEAMACIFSVVVCADMVSERGAVADSGKNRPTEPRKILFRMASNQRFLQKCKTETHTCYAIKLGPRF